MKGLLIGLALGAGMLLFEYLATQKSRAERSQKMAKKQELNQDERARMRNMVTFGLVILPLIGAGVFWLMGW